ncbi:hypothetical protein F1654_12155 [Alkalicaulis satelles]|uniref:NADH:quinone oxidoreductase/Mrp antiporter transmembrane domain-containing protein n=1 Tax=Alkalicaulis satelles TaxID=2609175 RepID=A0A5M6ZAA5_9PROT|nr:complex I subunit 5 family protein [Alkalicaulis satelles]KAA5801639.1 hypothetical protein F1654_12155 [Alkalicaulis satelles]
MSAIWLLPLALALPLTLALLSALPIVRDRSLSLAAAAPLPGLAAALLAPRGELLVLPDLVLGASLALSETGALFLGAASLLWLAAGLYARFYMRGKDRAGHFALFWNLCLAGNLGVFLAADAVTFYVAFALVSLMAFPLIIHDRSPKALKAGLAYIVLAVIGEAALLAGLMLAAGAAGGVTDIDAIADALWLSQDRALILALLIAGFGIKAGLVPLHVWLPVAHPAAPVPASAVLSGAIVKAGIFGLLIFLPLGESLTMSGGALAVLGFAGAFGAALYGLTQRDPKAVLAYSTVSQMGLIMAALGAGLAAGLEAGVLTAAAAIYALHHALAKGALFLGVGAVQAGSGAAALRQRAVLALIALSVAGLPLTGGSLAKLALKAPLDPFSEMLITASAFTTALLLARALALLRPDGAAGARAPLSRSLPVLVLGAGALALPWAVWPQSGLPHGYAWQVQALVSGAGPLMLAALVILAAQRWRLTGLQAPQGDLLATAWTALEISSALAGAMAKRLADALPQPGGRSARRLMMSAGEMAHRIERVLANRLASLMLLLVLITAALAL